MTLPRTNTDGAILTLPQQDLLMRHLSDNGIEPFRIVPGVLWLRFSCLKHGILCWQPVQVSKAEGGLFALNAPQVTTLGQIMQVINRLHDIGKIPLGKPVRC